jgi:NAD(P)-dependent dehydrogenase (short-subunit alcohol dehydrogenase family)
MTTPDPSVLILGGTSGIGRACAAALSDDGFAVTIVGRDAARAAALAGELGALASGAGADATDDVAVGRLFADLPRPTHVVVSLAGGSAFGNFVDLAPADLRRALETKLFAYLTVARHALRALAPGGSLTFVTGVSGLRPSPGASCLAIANSAIGALVETLAIEAAPVRVNAVAPGTTDTPAWSRMPEATRASMFTNMASRTPMGRIAQPHDVARLVRSLIRHDFLTGLVVPCDGGLRLT